MKNEYVEKINKLGNAGYVISKICSVLVIIGFVACLVGSALIALIPKDSVTITTGHETVIEMDMTHSILPNLVGIEADDDGSFEMNGIKYDQFEINNSFAKQTATAKATPYTYSLNKMLWITVAGAVMCLVMLNAMKKINTLFKNFKECETPFTIETVNDFKNLAVSLIPVMVMSWVVQAVTVFITTGVLDIEIGVDLTVVMCVVVILMMSEIFRYGTMLQTESDETL